MNSDAFFEFRLFNKGESPTRLQKFFYHFHPLRWPEPLRCAAWTFGMPIAWFIHFFHNDTAERMANWLDANCCY